jgi:hypothetical protein
LKEEEVTGLEELGSPRKESDKRKENLKETGKSSGLERGKQCSDVVLIKHNWLALRVPRVL